MPQVNNFKWTEGELSLAGDRNFILAKLNLTEKVMGLFGELERNLKEDIELIQPDFPGVNFSVGKIFRGENYRSFPYVLLDFPRLFNTESVFAFRTMFLWGHEFSFTIHLQGKALEHFYPILSERLTTINRSDIFICVNDSPWHYHFNLDNYLPLQDFITDNKLSTLNEKGFVKLAVRLSLNDQEKVIEKGKETMEFFFSLLR